MKAAEKYDVTKGTRFSTYAVPWISQSIARGIEGTSRNIRLPNDVYRNVQKYNALKEKLNVNKDQNEIFNELQKILNITIDEIKEYERLSQDTVSLNTELELNNDKGEKFLIETISDEHLTEDVVINKIRDEEVVKVIKKVIKEERNINILLEFHQSIKAKELAAKYGLSTQRIGSIVRKELEKLKQSKKILTLIEYASNEQDVIANLSSSDNHVKKIIKT